MSESVTRNFAKVTMQPSQLVSQKFQKINEISKSIEISKVPQKSPKSAQKSPKEAPKVPEKCLKVQKNCAKSRKCLRKNTNIAQNLQIAHKSQKLPNVYRKLS